MTTAATTTAKPRRRWLQFSLRAVLLLMVVIAVPLGWTLHKMRQQYQAVAALEKIGYWFDFTENVADSSALEMVEGLLDKNATGYLRSAGGPFQATDAGLVHLRALTHLEHLYLGNTQVTNAGLADVETLGHLISLDLTGTQITDAGLVHLHGLTQLESLNLSRTRITDAGLIYLEQIKSLQELNLDGTRITDAGLLHLRGLANLNVLRLSETPVTDAGLVHLRSFTHLGFLDLDGTQVTNAGLPHLQSLVPQLRQLILTRTQTTPFYVQELEKSLPKCEIRR